MDIASERIERDLAAALEAHAARVAAAERSIDGLCIDCGMAIEPARLAALHGCTARCVRCAARFETAQRRRA
ncbi:MAG: TraR/DksA family transcriptional regulator [Proteobacteria bacterium]|nr:TraR/DksA family transcriptional regulator [Pseudomonadota bacterium]